MWGKNSRKCHFYLKGTAYEKAAKCESVLKEVQIQMFGVHDEVGRKANWAMLHPKGSQEPKDF